MANSEDGKNHPAKNHAKLRSIVIVDDFSDFPISALEEIAALKKKYRSLASILHVVRLNSHSGTAFAKNRGFEEISQKLTEQNLNSDQHAIVFLDAHAIVSPYWLVPLASALSRYPKALVYPTLDTLTPSSPAADGSATWGVVRAEDNLVAAFDWALRPRWEPLPTEATKDLAEAPPADRVRSAPHTLETEAVEVMSPAAPGIFAVRASYFRELGQFDASMYSTSYSPAETVELSLRAWLCGGLVLKQRCSRVAHQSTHLFHDTAVGHGVTQASVDEAALNVAQKWLQGVPTLPPSAGSEKVSYQELTFRARFLNRVPYGVEIANDPILVSPAQSLLVENVKGAPKRNSNLHVCLPFHWYLQEVYPGLLADAPSVLQQFSAYLQSNYLAKQDPLNKLVSAYNQPPSEQKQIPLQTGLLAVRAAKLEKYASFALSAGTAGSLPLASVKRRFVEPIGPKAMSRSDMLMAHSLQVQQELICEDFPEKVYAQSCEAKVSADPQICSERKPDMLFQCPKSCKYCAKEDGKFCEDFYLNKCPAWQSQGRCGEEDADYGKISSVCRKSCGICTPQYATKTALSADIQAKVVVAVKPAAVAPQMSEKEAEYAKVDKMIHGAMTVDPNHLHTEYLKGNVPDRVRGDDVLVTSNDQCSVEKPDAQLLSRVALFNLEENESLHVDSQGNPLRIFCGIYTMQKNHNTNARATRNTWAKKCDGFIAFSTFEDPSIPSVDILHEGVEAYDNMWQKSRSIWKYIYTHLVDRYDFFLLGGDDMFYIVENLRHYLGSEEITKLKNEGDGLYIGRIFQPPNQVVFNSGGAGYLLDVKALMLLGKNIDSPKCFPHQTGFWEDVNVANCLKRSSPSILPYDTRDPLLRERFHPFTPGAQLSYRIPPKNPDWYAKYNPELKVGYDCCSDESISFHYVKEDLLYRLYNYVYHCDAKIAH